MCSAKRPIAASAATRSVSVSAVPRTRAAKAWKSARVPYVRQDVPHGLPDARLHLEGELVEPAFDAGELDGVRVDAADRGEEEDAIDQQKNDEDREPYR